MAVDVVVPPLGATVDTFTLVAWYKKEGEFVTKDELLFAVETDKAVLDVEAPATGVLRRVSAAVGDEVDALSRIAVIVPPDEADGASNDGDNVTGSSGQAVSDPTGLASYPMATGSANARVLISP